MKNGETGDAERVRLDIRELTLSIEGNPVLRGIDLTAGGGRITALAGPNGAGKSSIIKCISGYYRDVTAEALRVDNHELAVPCDAKAMRNAGLRIVHQDLGLVGDLSTFDNLALSAIDLRGMKLVPRRSWEQSMATAVHSLGGEFDIHRPVHELRPYERVIAAVARASYSPEGYAPMSVLVLDEVTAALPADEVQIVLDRLRRVAVTGVAVLFVTHHFDEIVEVADDLIVVRDGRVTSHGPTRDLTTDAIAELVFGGVPLVTETAISSPAGAIDPSTHRLDAQHLSGRRVRDVNLRVEGGTIVGITGRVGSGKSELGRLLSGRQPVTAGAVTVGDRVLGDMPLGALAGTLGYVPQDRASQGVIREMSLSENIHFSARSLPGRGGSRTRLWSDRRLREHDAALLSKHHVHPARPEVLMRALSGGNQQKLLFLRALISAPGIVIVDEPTIGVDVLSRAHLHAMLRERADAGAAVLVISSDAEEVLAVSDTVRVMTDGHLGEPIDAATTSVAVLEAHIASGGVNERKPS